MKDEISTKISRLDIVVLQQIKEAKDERLAVVPTLIDNLVRLSQIGFVANATDGDVTITPRGRTFLEIRNAAAA